MFDQSSEVVPPDVTLQVAHVGKWRVFSASYRGLQHVDQKLPRQDVYAFANQNGAMNIAVADGLGSASLSHIGAQLACDTGVALLSRACPRRKADFLALYQHIQEEFFSFSEKHGLQPNHFATTLQLLQIDNDGFAYGRLGDGGCVLLKEEGARWLGGFDRSELGPSNLSIPNVLSRLETDFVALDGVAGFLIFSDGLEDIFLTEGKRATEEENVRRIVSLVREQDIEQLLALFNKFLSSDGNKDLRDDKTIIAGAVGSRWRPPDQPSWPLDKFRAIPELEKARETLRRGVAFGPPSPSSPPSTPQTPSSTPVAMGYDPTKAPEINRRVASTLLSRPPILIFLAIIATLEIAVILLLAGWTVLLRPWSGSLSPLQVLTQHGPSATPGSPPSAPRESTEPPGTSTDGQSKVGPPVPPPSASLQSSPSSSQPPVSSPAPASIPPPAPPGQSPVVSPSAPASASSPGAARTQPAASAPPPMPSSQTPTEQPGASAPSQPPSSPTPPSASP
jgi:hypothetical protein